MNTYMSAAKFDELMLGVVERDFGSRVSITVREGGWNGGPLKKFRFGPQHTVIGLAATPRLTREIIKALGQSQIKSFPFEAIEACYQSVERVNKTWTDADLFFVNFIGTEIQLLALMAPAQPDRSLPRMLFMDLAIKSEIESAVENYINGREDVAEVSP
ncbi:MAG: hypothetical protein J0I77_01825 [Rudaea sp.]|uniref:hypothetical protein n=1 Tax=unclassified Rudaea TaxID=2627037 RepID=UPI0010F925F0|nr:MULTISPECIES: hypothetical protein [unclassified Rudaea]MBN8884433.1 hypothetical protein [Rudaea sp.]